MNRYFKIILILTGVFFFNSCGENYLDIVPDERGTEEDAFKDPNAARGYLYSIYGYIPNQRSGTSSIDLMTSDETVTAFEHEVFAGFPRGEYTASSPVISYWNNLYKGIRQAYIFLDRVDDVPELSSSKAEKYKAEADFLIAYFHFLLLRMYGPVVIADHEYDVNTDLDPEDFPMRATYEESVDFIAERLDAAAQELPMEQNSSSNYGRATSVVAKAVKARMLLYAASPLFNGGGENGSSLYDNFTNKEGENLIPTSFDKEKWKRAADANKDAIDIAESAGVSLYQNSSHDSSEPTDPVEKDLRFTFVDRNSKEIIWAETRQESAYDFQNKSTPYNSSGGSWNGVAPTIELMEHFYTENGLPIDKDPSYDYSHRFDVTSSEHGSTLKFNLNREPRFNAWISYHNGEYEIIRDSDNKIVTQYRRDDAHGIQGRNNNYSPTGYLNKKGVAPGLEQTSLSNPNVQYPWPVFRLSELYLNYAEALIEYGQDLETAKEYIDRVRERAGIPSIDDAWSAIGGANDQETLREIVRQERTNEFYLENHRFWDLRRWMTAKNALGDRVHGMNISGATDEEFFQVTEVDFPRSFNDNNYLMPIPQSEMNKNETLIQNPGY